MSRHTAVKERTPRARVRVRAAGASLAQLRRAPEVASERLAFGLALAGDIVVAIGLISFFVDAPGYPLPWFSAAAWLVLLVALIAAQTAMAKHRPLGRLGFVLLLAACGVAVVLDLIGTWHPSPTAAYPAAATAVGGVLVLTATRRSERVVLAALAVLALCLIGASVGRIDEPLAFGPRMLVLVLALLPPLIALSIVRSFRIMVQYQTDLTQARSATAAGSAVGILTSDELAKLDLAAERLLDDVATGRADLPLDEVTAGRASSLATQLRMHLIEDRRVTWLYHAIAESAVLDPAVTLTDPHGLAANLDPRQRDGLLTALWLLVDSVRPNPRVMVAISGVDGEPDTTRGVRLGIDITGVPHRNVDPAAWQAIARVGRHTRSFSGSTARVEVFVALDAAGDR